MESWLARDGDRALRALRILVVDPYPPGRDSLCACLDDLGHAASGARDVRDATRLLGHGRVDLLLVDHSPPFTDGWRSLEALRRDHWISAIVLVDIEMASSPVASSLLKPVSLNELERAIAGIRRSVSAVVA